MATSSGYFTLDPAVGSDETVCDWPAPDGDVSTYCARRAVGGLEIGGTVRHVCRRHRAEVVKLGMMFDLEVRPVRPARPPR